MSEKSSTQVHPSGELLKKSHIVSEWGAVAFQLLLAIKGKEAKKKRLTLLKMADFAAQGKPISWAFRFDFTGSKSIHYRKWMRSDEPYIAAYNHLIGQTESPGLARTVFNQEQMANTADSVASLARARLEYEILAPKAAAKAADLLDAKTKVFMGLDGDGAPIIEDVDDNQVQLGAVKHIAKMGLIDLPKAAQEKELHGADQGIDLILDYAADWREVQHVEEA